MGCLDLVGVNLNNVNCHEVNSLNQSTSCEGGDDRRGTTDGVYRINFLLKLEQCIEKGIFDID